jgi:tRNA pseudouridine38-40 synthase
MRVALGLSYLGQAYEGWQSQRSMACTVQDNLEAALSDFCQQPVHTLCAGRTDSGVHGLMQVVHLDTDSARHVKAGCAAPMPSCPRHCGAVGARSTHQLSCPRQCVGAALCLCGLVSPRCAPAWRAGRVGWVFRPLCKRAHARSRPVFAGRTRFQLFSGLCLPSTSARLKTCARSTFNASVKQDSAYWRFDLKPMLFCTT